MKWIKRKATVEEGTLESGADIVPKTEITGSRQALNNINLALNTAGESSGESSKKLNNEDKKGACKNKYCCDVSSDHDDDDDEAHCKSSLIDNLRADNNAHTTEGSTNDETECRRPRVIRNVNGDDYVIRFDPHVDYAKLECPDSAYTSIIKCPSVKYGKYVQLKPKKDRIRSENFDLLLKTDKVKTADEKSILNYKLLSNIERHLDETKYNLFNCKLYNEEYRKINKKFGRPPLKIEDFNDDFISTRMSADTRAIKEFYRLSIESNVLLHYQEIAIDTGRAIENYSDGFTNFFNWLILKGKEIKDEDNESSWIKKVLKFFRKMKHPRNKAEKNDPGDGVEAYTLALAQDESSIFAKNIYNFIACTRESREKIPHKVMRNIRQFMNGMKNYLVKHGEKDFANEVDKARAALKPDEFLNLDQILEGVMHQLVILPLKEYLYELFVDYYGSRGDLELIINNMKFAESKDPSAFGVKKGLKTPSPQALSRISMLFAKLQEAELPFEKLDFLLTAMTMILDNTSDPECETNDVRHFGCDDFLPLLAYVLCKCGFHFAEIEAEYIWGLMMPTVMNGQAGYYTTSLCSAAISLKEFKQRYETSGVSAVSENFELSDSGFPASI